MTDSPRKDVDPRLAPFDALIGSYTTWQKALDDGDVFAGDYAHSAFLAALSALASEHLEPSA